MTLPPVPDPSSPSAPEYIKLPMRAFQWLVLALIAGGGGYAGGRVPAGQLSALERQFDRLDKSLTDLRQDLLQDLDEKVEREVEREVRRVFAEHAAQLGERP